VLGEGIFYSPQAVVMTRRLLSYAILSLYVTYALMYFMSKSP
jgi:hypothetical protein